MEVHLFFTWVSKETILPPYGFESYSSSSNECESDEEKWFNYIKHINKYNSNNIFFNYNIWVSGSGTPYADNTFYFNDNE